MFLCCRNRTDLNIVLDTLVNKNEFHDKVSTNFHQAMQDVKDMFRTMVEVVNMSYSLQLQDEKDRESIYLMGINQKNTQTVNYKNSEVPPISLDKNCLS